jgi:hypothetical protein
MDYGSHTPYIVAAYAASIITIGVLIFWRLHALSKAQAAERHEKQA